jgi:hypothetical protein
MLLAMPSVSLRAVISLLLVVGGCSCGASGALTRAEGTEEAIEGYEVHEWGLVRGLAGDRLEVGAVGPPPSVFPMVVDKPVLYFHTASPFTLRAVRVHASGAILEAWPFGSRTEGTGELTWMDVAIDPTASECVTTPLPSTCDPDLSPCEIPSLALVRTAESPCIRVAGATDTMLFYRSRVEGMTPPLLFTRTGTEEVTVTHEGDEPIEGLLIRLRSVMGQVLTLAVDPPAPHQSVVVGADFGGAAMDEDGDMPALPGGPEVGRAAVRASLAEIGLTEQESDAFLRAWDGALFGLEVADRRTIDSLTNDESALVDGLPVPVDSFLYFLPPSSTEAVSSLELDPPARSVVRAMAMWSVVPASGSSR